MLFLSLIQNLALLVTLSVVQMLILRQWTRQTAGYQLLSGLLYGSVAVVAIMTSVSVSPGIVFDGRSIILGVAGFFGGPWVGAIAAAMAVTYRVMLGGAGMTMGIAVSVSSALIGVGMYYLRRRYPQVAGIAGLWVFALLVHFVMLALTTTLPATVARDVFDAIAFPVAVGYPIVMVLISRLMLDQEERLESSRELRATASRLRAIIDQTEQGVTMGKPDGSISIYNDAMVRLTGYTREEVEEHGWFELAYPTEERRAHAIALATEALEGNLPYIEIPIVRKDGAERWVSFASTPIELDDGIHNLSIITDITAQRLAEQRMRELDEIVSRSPAVAFTWSVDRCWPILFASRSIALFGYDAEDLIAAQTCHSELMADDDVERIASEVSHYLAGGEDEFDLEYRLKVPGTGERWVAEHTWIVRDSNGEPVRLQGVLVDIHARKVAELELERHRDHLDDLVKERTHELTRVNRELRQANAAKSQLLANMSHELRTPMNSIIGFSSVLGQGLSGPLSSEQQEQVEMIQTAGAHLMSLINDMLDLSRLEVGRVEVEIDRFEPGEIVREVAAYVGPLAAEKGISVEYDLGPDLPTARSDAGKVRQILLNLAGNAVKFTREGVVTIDVRRDGQADLVFTVSDTGPGISADSLQHIFEAFVQIEQPGEVKPTGTGLGLTISREYAHLLGGDVHVESRIGVGSTFTLTIPISLPETS